MEGNNIPMGNILQLIVHISLQFLQLANINSSIGLVSLSMVGICITQLLGNIFHLLNGIIHIQPYMRIWLAIFLQKRNILAGINNSQIFVLLDYLVQKGFHAGTVGHKNICLFQSFHIISGELIIVETAGLRLGHIGKLYAIHTLGNIGGSNIHRIEGSNDVQLAILFGALLGIIATAC